MLSFVRDKPFRSYCYYPFIVGWFVRSLSRSLKQQAPEMRGSKGVLGADGLKKPKYL